MKFTSILVLFGLFLPSTPLHAQGKLFAYVANEGSNSVSVYSVDRTTGVLVPVSVSATGSLPTSITVHPTGRFAYVTNFGATNGIPSISEYAIDPDSGALNELPGSPVPTGLPPGPLHAAIDPSGRFMYVANDTASNNPESFVLAFNIDSNTGILNQISGSPYPTNGINTGSLVIDPMGRFVFVGNASSNNILAYTINSNTGALTLVAGSPFPSGTNPQVFAVDPAGRFLYVYNDISNDIWVYAIDPNSGTLGTIPSSPFPTGSSPCGATMDSAGRFLYVPNRGSNTVSAYSIDSNTGALSQLPGSPFVAGSGPFGATIDPTGKFLYVVNIDGNNVSAYTINADTGALTPIPGSLFLTGTEPVWITVINEIHSYANGKILFASDADGDYEIYSINPDGTGQLQLTNNTAQDRYPAASPNGSRIAFSSDRDVSGNMEIYVMNADGSNPKRLTSNFGDCDGPRWSPDGTQIVFMSNYDGNYEIYKMNVDGTNIQQLTSNSVTNGNPFWSPDGTKIVFDRGDGVNAEIWVMNVDGSGQTQLTHNGDQNVIPRWSPDGTRIIFRRDGAGGWMEIYVMNANGSGQTNLTNNWSADGQAVWSPDGTKIAFQSNREDNAFEIYIMNADGTNSKRLTFDNQYKVDLDWAASFTINAHTLTSVVSSMPISVFRQTVTFTATILADNGTPSCQVAFKDGITALGTSALDSSGHATFATSTLTVGSHAITAEYSGDVNFLPSTSDTITQVVNLGATVQLIDSHGNGIAGAAVQYYSGGWQNFGNTGSDGQVSKQMASGTYTFRVIYAGSSNDKSQNIGTAPVVIFQTINAVVQLMDSSGTPLDTGSVRYYGGSWTTFGSTANGQASKELLPGTYSFRMTYAGVSNDKSQNIAANHLVVFQTAGVLVQLQNHSGNLMDSGSVQYYGSSWLALGPTSGGIVRKELLPGTYSFRMTYGGISNDKSQNVGLNPTVVFQTVNATVQLMDSSGAPLDTGSVQYYASSWTAFGSTANGQASKELLPGTYSFRMTYAGVSNDKSQNIAVNPVVMFQTVSVTALLVDSNGNPLDTAVVQYYGNAWTPFGSTSGGQVSKEFMPGTYSFRMSYAGASIDKSQNIAANPQVRFQTGKVVSASGTCTFYYAGGWRPFVNGMELLPMTYSFQFNGYPQTSYQVAAGTATSIH